MFHDLSSRLSQKTGLRRRGALACLGIIVFLGCERSADSPDRRPDAASPTVRRERANAVSPRSSVRFRDVTAESQVDIIYDNGEAANEMSIVESLGGGVGVLDYDRDGRPDLFFPTGGSLPQGEPLPGLPHRLFRNLGDMRFVEQAAEADLAAARTYTHGCAAADVDNDGFPDLIVTGYAGLQYYRNRGDGTFADATDVAGFTDDQWSSSAGWGDFDRDGLVDLYVTHYVDWSWEHHPRCPQPVPGGFDICAPSDFEPLGDLIYHNQGDGTFRPLRQEVGLRPDGKGLGVIIADFDLADGVDIYVANDTTNNFLYVNQGDGSFRERALIHGVAVDGDGISNGSMGLAVIDLENDLQPDLWVTNYENETFALYRNSGNGNFLWGTENAGVNALGTLFVGFGTTVGDFDLDGDEDVVVANGHVMRFPERASIAQEPLLLVNSTRGMPNAPAGRLLRQPLDGDPDNYFAQAWRGRGVVKSDLDQDGDLDLVFSHMNQPAAVLANESAPGGSALQVDLVGTSSNRDAIGSYAVLQTDQGSYARMVVGGGSYLSQDTYQMTWSIPTGESFRSLTIRWPDGQEQVIQELAGDGPLILRQPGTADRSSGGR